MGSYYGMGIVKNIINCSTINSTETKLREMIGRFVDINLYNMKINGDKIYLDLKKNVFKDNIEDLYHKLEDIVESDYIKYTLNEEGNNLDNYQDFNVYYATKDNNGNKITFYLTLALLFCEGKVLVEQFSFEPKIMNWALRNTKDTNPLFRCIMSSIIG